MASIADIKKQFDLAGTSIANAINEKGVAASWQTDNMLQLAEKVKQIQGGGGGPLTPRELFEKTKPLNYFNITGPSTLFDPPTMQKCTGLKLYKSGELSPILPFEARPGQIRHIIANPSNGFVFSTQYEYDPNNGVAIIKGNPKNPGGIVKPGTYIDYGFCLLSVDYVDVTKIKYSTQPFERELVITEEDLNDNMLFFSVPRIKKTDSPFLIFYEV